MKKNLLLFGFVSICFLFSAFNRADAQITITLQNDSEWTFYEMYMTASDYESWGEDLLEMSGQSVLINGQAITITVPKEGYWDLKIVDEDGDECKVTQMYISDDEIVHITTDMMLDCYE